jgi:hypothetical protein
MPSKLNTLYEDYVQEPEEPILSAEALKLAKEMEPEELCHFLKILDNLQEKGVSEKELSGGVSAEELLDIRNEIRRIIINKISGAIDLSDHQKPAKHRKPTGELAQVLEFPIKPKSVSMTPITESMLSERKAKRARRHFKLIK